MTQTYSFKKILINKIIGILIIIFAIFSFISLIYNNPSDPGFGSYGSNDVITNLMGIQGAYYSSFLLAFVGYSAYIFSLFFLILGSSLILVNTKKNSGLKIFFLLIGIVLSNLSITLAGFDFSILGRILKDLVIVQINIFFNLKILYWSLILVLFSLSFFCFLFSFGIKIKKFFSWFNKLWELIFILFKPFKFLKIFFIKKNKTKVKESGFLSRKYQKKQEPTFLKKKIYKRKEEYKTPRNMGGLNSSKYTLPPISLLKKSLDKKISIREIEKRNIQLSEKLEKALEEYGVSGKIINFKSGPVVTLFEFLPAAGIKTSKVVSLSDDISRAMSSISTRIAAQPGKTSLGIEIPNEKREDVLLGDLISISNFFEQGDGLTLALGKNISGEKKFTDLEKMPHLLIAGTTGSGKSVGINSMIISLLFRFTPSECKLILIDPKMLELSIYADIPHLLTPVVTNPNKAVFALKWVVREMENRYKLMSSVNVKNIKSFNQKIINTQSKGRKLFREVQTGIDRETRQPIIEKKEIPLDKMPLIVVVIDEMADLMMVAGKEVENLVQRLAQMARASGIHIIAATQRPSVDVITGTIKANFPSRISFRVASRFDSRTILNEMGAEQLLGSGDMLFLENGASLKRLHGGFISENEIESVVEHIKSQKTNETQQDITIENSDSSNNKLDLGLEEKNVDELYEKALQIVMDQQKVSTSFIQRYLQIGYNRAARIVEKMEEDGYITEANNSGKRSVIQKK